MNGAELERPFDMETADKVVAAVPGSTEVIITESIVSFSIPFWRLLQSSRVKYRLAILVAPYSTPGR